MQQIFKDLLGESFLFAVGDETWKLKRKACAPGFYKEKLHDLVKAMKQTTYDTIETWKKKLD